MNNFAPISAHQMQRIKRAGDLIPGRSTNSLSPPAGLEFLIDHAQGPYVYDIDGRRYLDFMLGAGPVVLGHAKPRITQAITR